MKVVIAGGGATGCFAALLLARAGHEVLVLERDRLEPASAEIFRPEAPQLVHGAARPAGLASDSRRG